MKTSTFTSESVCAGHPDNLCDQVSDTILDEALRQDKYSRVAIETMVTENFAILAGEITSAGKIDYEAEARKMIARLGYTDPELKFTDKSPIEVRVHSQSRDIAAGVDRKGAGDQGMMFGYACRETDVLMPMPIMIAHKLAMRIDEVREKKIIPMLRPDGKTQVTVRYEDGVPVGLDGVVLAVPHHPDLSLEDLKDQAYEHIVVPVLDMYKFTFKKEDVVVNGTGVWHLSGPAADTGATGRKIVVDTYGGMGRVGGGCFSGKDPTKVDRSGAYAARFLAKNIVAAGLADRCEVRLAYFIGAIKPMMQQVETFGTEKKSQSEIQSFMNKILDTSVEGILERFDLRRPLYVKTAAYGHFGREEFPWEEIV